MTHASLYCVHCNKAIIESEGICLTTAIRGLIPRALRAEIYLHNSCKADWERLHGSLTRGLAEVEICEQLGER